MPVIDCHVHLNNYHVEKSTPTEEHLRRLREQMTRHRLDHCIALTSYIVNPHRPSAAQISDLLKGDPRISLVEGIGVTAEEAVDWEGVAARLKAGQTRGLKFYPGYEHVYPNDKAFEPAIELAGKYHVPVMIHTGDTYAPSAKLKYAHPMHVDEVAVDFPDVNFIICHVGNPWFRDTAELLYKDANVYADISGLVLEEFTAPLESLMREELEELIVYSGENDKILFGTDWPLVRMGPYLRFVKALDIPPRHRSLLMGGNAARLFKLPFEETPKPPPTSDVQARPPNQRPAKSP